MPASRSPSKRAISARPNSRIFFRPRSSASHFSFSWNGSIKWISATRMRKLTPRLPIAGSPNSSGSLAGSLCSAFVRLSIPLEGKRSCTFWASTDLNGTAFWSADFARIFRWWILGRNLGFPAACSKTCLGRQKNTGCHQEIIQNSAARLCALFPARWISICDAPVNLSPRPGCRGQFPGEW
jgi:hypothetical protein